MTRLAAWLVFAALVSITSTARAQMGMGGGGRSLGGYGGPTITSYYTNGGGVAPAMANGRMLLPPTASPGGMGATVPRRVSETPIGGVMMGGSTPIGGISAPGAMGRSSRSGMGMGLSVGSGRMSPAPYGSGGMSGMSAGMGGGMRRSPYGPGLGSPFRQPPSLPGSSSMSMP